MTDNYKLFGLREDATDEEITERYQELKQKYSEERWLDGEAGNEAAKMLTKIQIAYNEIMAERKEKAQNTEGVNSFEARPYLPPTVKMSRFASLITVATSS